jgi:hypothetical protein
MNFERRNLYLIAMWFIEVTSHVIWRVSILFQFCAHIVYDDINGLFKRHTMWNVYEFLINYINHIHLVFMSDEIIIYKPYLEETFLICLSANMTIIDVKLPIKPIKTMNGNMYTYSTYWTCILILSCAPPSYCPIVLFVRFVTFMLPTWILFQCQP